MALLAHTRALHLDRGLEVAAHDFHLRCVAHGIVVDDGVPAMFTPMSVGD